MNQIVFLFAFTLCFPTFVFGQAASDSLGGELNYRRFINRVIEFHPASRIADLEIDQAEAVLLQARAGFEPSVSAFTDSKTLDNKNYWDKRDANISVATPFAAKIKGGVEQADGDFLNPENSTVGPAQWYAEIEMPLLRNLLTDKRRIQLRKARNIVEASQAMRRQLLNELLIEATQAYWLWTQAFNEVDLSNELIDIARVRHRAVVQSFQNGDFAAIDTLESYINWQNRIQEWQEMSIQEINARAEMNSFLWGNDVQPLSISKNARPIGDFATEPWLENLIAADFSTQAIAASLPQIQMARLKRDNKRLEYRLARENLKPELNVAYKQFSGTQVEGYPLDVNDHQIRLALSMPLLLRAPRAQVQNQKVETKRAELELEQKIREIALTLEASLGELRRLNRQLNVVDDLTGRYLQLVRAEETEFRLGESSLFLINQRENQYQMARQKAIRVESKLAVKAFSLFWLLQNDDELGFQ